MINKCDHLHQIEKYLRYYCRGTANLASATFSQIFLKILFYYEDTSIFVEQCACSKYVQVKNQPGGIDTP